MSTINAEPKAFGTEGVANDSKHESYKPDNISVANGQHRDEESMTDIKEGEALDPYGNEEGAEIQCRCLELLFS